MRHPLEFIPSPYRKRAFFTFLFLTVILFAVFQVLDQPLRTDAAPNGIVSFELARTPEKAQQILAYWMPIKGFGIQKWRESLLYASFGLGIDYLFMPIYALALSFGTLLAAQKHGGWIKSLGALAGYGAFAAALFDAVENYALLQILLGLYESSYPAIAAFCASIKFGLLIFGLLYALVGWMLPKRWGEVRLPLASLCL